MTRGFTLLELLITVAVLSILLATAAPSFSSISESSKMNRLAPEIHNFFITARSEAVFNNKNLYVHFSVNHIPDTTDSTGSWAFTLTDSSTAGSGSTYLILDGSTYRDITVAFRFTNQTYFKVDGIRGRFRDGSVKVNPKNSVEKRLEVIASETTGRIRVCSADPDPNARNNIGYYGYEIC